MSSPMRRDPGVSIDKTSLSQVEALARQHFDIEGTANVLSSEIDETFLIRGTGGAGYILKIARPDERADILQFQSDALVHLSSKHICVPTPRPLSTADGKNLVSLTFGDHQRIMRVLTCIDGMLLSNAPRVPGQMRALGHALAALDNGLADFHLVVPEQNLVWDLCRASTLRELLPSVGTERQAMVEPVLDAFDRLAAGIMNDLPRQVIHNDFNPHNILVDPNEPARVTGVIDFGDLVEAPAVNDLAVALSYHVFSGDGLDDVVAVMLAYHKVRRISAEELACLPTLVRTRLAMTIIVSEWRSSLDPANSRYLLRNHAKAHGGLVKLSPRSDAELTAFFERSIGDLP